MLSNKKQIFNLILVTSFLMACSSSNEISSSAVVTQFNNAMKSAGSQLQSTGLVNGLSSGMLAKATLVDVDDVCDENATPMDGVDYMDQNDPEYPARLFYCKVVKDSGSPESIPGSYGQTRSIACALEKAGIVFDGVEHEATISVDEDCFSAAELADDEMPSSFEITYKASEPAFFNSNFQRGIQMTIPDFGTFTLATSVEGSSIKFMGYENQGSTKTGVYVGEFDSDSGEIRFEGRHDRFNCSEEGSCGWTKHDRIYLKCGSINADGECEDIQEVQGASSEIFDEPIGGRIATISGDFSQGVKTRFYSNSEGDFNDPEKWTENTLAADQCYTLTSATSGDCASNNGIRITGTSPFFFTLYDGYTPNSEWYMDIEGLDFTSISLLSE